MWMPAIPARSVNPEGVRRPQLCLSHTDQAFPTLQLSSSFGSFPEQIHQQRHTLTSPLTAPQNQHGVVDTLPGPRAKSAQPHHCSTCVCAGDSEEMEGQRGAEEPLGQEKTFSLLGDSALLGDYKELNWWTKDSQVVCDISGQGIWQPAAWSRAKSPGLAGKC
ncbi:hypothetical protein EYF80_000831 [Liparis tanakae]|uniref:Uncharacterized protein n=1 Tax=Liparis tanakae TaxID=230148 RepID=A0A4Z2JGG2_9TELE|nr:hypothetical protein EYF80_000831 [Liparis tanakae]